MRRNVVLSLLLLPTVLSSGGVLAGESSPVANTKVRTLAAFKNGLGFVYRSGEVKLKDGYCLMNQLPAATLGALWFGSMDPKSPLLEVASFQDKVEWESLARNAGELVTLNPGKEVTLTVSTQGNVEKVSGTIISVSKPEPVPAEYVRVGGRNDNSYYGSQYPTGMEVVMIRTKDGRTLAINQNMIIGAEFSGDPVVKSKTAYEVARAKLKFGGKGDKADLTMAYLEKGINWSPSYLINIADPAQADITMEAVLANDAEDLEDVDVSFVVGYPNFMFADNFCPLTPGQTIAEFVRRLSESSSRPRDIDGRVTSQSTWNFALDNSVLTRSGVWSPNSVYSANQPLPGESNEDLYFYHQGNVSLKKGERARYTVFTAKVPYEHVYQWRIADTMKIDDHGYRRDNNADKDQPDPVWHSLRLTNTTQYPWTTAPALVTNGSMPLSQDVLNYVAAGGAKTLLRLTVASDVRGQQVQTEAKRERVELPGYYCDKVTVDGKLSVANWKKTPIRLNVVKSLVGEVVTAGDAGKTSKVVKSLTGLNPTSEIVWEFDLKPNEEKVLTYQYTAFVRR